MTRSRPVWPLLLTIALAILGVGINFNRLLLHLSTHLPGDPDPAATALWHLWWPPFGEHQSDGLTIHAFAGAPFLANHLRAMPILPSIPFMLVARIGGPLLAFNVVLIASQVGTQIATTLWLRAKGAPTALAILGGFALAISGWYTGIVAQPDPIAASLWLLPLALLAWDAWLREPDGWHSVLVVAALVGAILSGVQHLAWIAALWLPYAVWTGRAAWIGADDGSRRRMGDGASLMALLFLIAFFIYPGPILVRTLQGNEPAYASAAIPPPPELRSFLGEIRRAGPAIFLAAFGALAVSRPRREATLWLVLGGLCFLVGTALLPDPIRMIAGALALPYQPLYERTVFFGLCLFALVAFSAISLGDALAGTPVSGSEQPAAASEPVRVPAWVQDRRVRWGAGIAAVLILVAANTAALRGLPIHPVRAYPFYASIAPEPEDYLLLSYPYGLVSAGDGRSLGSDAYLFEYGVWHHKRSLGGVLPYVEPVVMDRFAAMPFLFPDQIAPGAFEEAAAQMAEAVTTWRIGYVVAHADLLTPDRLAALDRLAEASEALCPAVERDGLIVYRARWHPYGCEEE